MVFRGTQGVPRNENKVSAKNTLQYKNDKNTETG
jgi:hypothetical protein